MNRRSFLKLVPIGIAGAPTILASLAPMAEPLMPLPDAQWMAAYIAKKICNDVLLIIENANMEMIASDFNPDEPPTLP